MAWFLTSVSGTMGKFVQSARGRDRSRGTTDLGHGRGNQVGLDEFNIDAVRKIGRSGGSPTYAYSSSPYWSHGIMAWFLTSVSG
jgi:hypothetical protein